MTSFFKLLVVMDGVVYGTRLMVGRIAAAIDGFIYIFNRFQKTVVVKERRLS